MSGYYQRDTTPTLSGRDMAERLAADVARLPFAQVRFNYFVNWYAKSTTLAKSWSDTPADWDIGDSPKPSSILESLTALLKIRPPGIADVDANPVQDLAGDFTERLRVAIATNEHPYDKVGAILSVFKDYRSTLALAGNVRLYTEHIKLRSLMTHLLDEFSLHALRNTKEAVLSRGFGETLSAAYDQETVTEYLKQGANSHDPEPSLDLLFHGEGSIVVQNWSTDKTSYMLRSSALGKALRKVPPELMYLFCGDGIQRFANMGTTPRKPDFWFVVKHYLATHSDETWSRPFVVDTLLRHGKAIYGDEGEHQLNYHEEERWPAPAYPSQLAPTMDDAEFAQKWRRAEKAAWRDYRHLRTVLIEADPQGQVPKLTPPAKTDIVQLLRKQPTEVFAQYFPPGMLPSAPKLLSAAIPGLGMHYQAVIDLDSGLQIGRDAMASILSNSAADLLAATRSEETYELPAELSL